MGAYVTRTVNGKQVKYYKDDGGRLHRSYDDAVNYQQRNSTSSTANSGLSRQPARSARPQQPASRPSSSRSTASFNLNSLASIVGGSFRNAYNEIDRRFANGNLPGGAPSTSSNRSSFPRSQGSTPRPQQPASRPSTSRSTASSASRFPTPISGSSRNSNNTNTSQQPFNLNSALGAVSAAGDWLRQQGSIVYGNVDRIFGGGLPGGADSPLVGKSTDPEQLKNAVNTFNDFAIASQIPRILDLAQNGLYRVMNANASRVQVPIYEFDGPNSIDSVRKEVNRGLPSTKRILFGEMTPFTNPSFTPSTNTMNLNSRVNFMGIPMTNPSLALHEMGHGKDYARSPMKSTYGKPIAPGSVSVPFAFMGSQSSEETPLWQSVLAGAAAGWMTPGPSQTLIDEFNASRNAVALAKQHNLPRGLRVLGPAFGTYATSFARPGAVEGLLGAVAERAATALGTYIDDNVVDPLADSLRGNEYSPTEQSLLKYGYNEKDFRIKPNPENRFNNSAIIERK